MVLSGSCRIAINCENLALCATQQQLTCLNLSQDGPHPYFRAFRGTCFASRDGPVDLDWLLGHLAKRSFGLLLLLLGLLVIVPGVASIASLVVIFPSVELDASPQPAHVPTIPFEAPIRLQALRPGSQLRLVVIWVGFIWRFELLYSGGGAAPRRSTVDNRQAATGSSVDAIRRPPSQRTA
jgi:hypothetical protein